MGFYTLFEITIVSVAATSAMTLFSYIISAKFRELYKEPVLLTFLLTKTNLELPLQTKKVLAWLIHYAIGFIFVLAYQIIWVTPFLDISITSGFVLGCILGIIGIGGWMLLFKIADYKPKINFKGYYIQLFLAHIIFGLTVVAAYWILSSVRLLIGIVAL